MGKRRRAGFVLASLLVLPFGQSGVAHAAPAALKLHYTAELLGIDALEFSIAIAQDDGKYRIQVEGMTEGVVDWFVGWRNFTDVDGTLQKVDTRPEDYHAVNLFRGRRSVVAMRYTQDGGVEAKADPPPGDDRDPVGAQQRRSTVDTLTAGLVLSRRLAAGEACDGRIPVFDGRRRYDLVMEDGGRSPISMRKTLPRIETAQICWFRIHRIAGFKKKGHTYDKPEFHDRRYRVVAGSVAEGFPPLALDVTGEFSLGSFRIHLVRMERGEPNQIFASGPQFDASAARSEETLRSPSSQAPR